MIIERQITKLVNDAFDKALIDGKTIDIDKVSRIIREELAQLNGGPLFKPTVVTNGQINLPAINKMFSDIEFDMSIIYDCIKEKFAAILNKYNLIDISYRSQIAQVNQIDTILDGILFGIANADDNFYGIKENITSTDNIDLINTTEGAIDLSEGCIHLPASVASAQKLVLSHLYELRQGVFNIKSLDNSRIINSNSLPNHHLGNIFNDANSLWIHRIYSESDKGVTLSVTFPVRSDNQIERITRLEIEGISGSDITAELRLSLDNENFTPPEGVQPKIIKDRTEKIAWDFSDRSCRYIRLIFTIPTPASQTNTTSDSSFTNPNLLSSTPSVNIGWLYYLPIKNVSIYKIGRSKDCIFQSKPLIPFGKTPEPISSISLVVEEELSRDTFIDYEIGISDNSGNLVGSFAPINPSNKTNNTLPKSISFSQDVFEKIDFSISEVDINTGNTITYKNKNLYNIYSLPNTEEYRFESAKLYRGLGVLSKDTNDIITTKNVKDNFIDFSDGIRNKSLYTYETEVASVVNRNLNSNSTKSFLKLNGPILESNRKFRDVLNDPVHTIDLEPDYSIAKIDHLRPNTTITNDNIMPSATGLVVNGTLIPVADSWMASTNNSSSIGVPILYNGNVVDILKETVELKYISTGSSLVHTFREGIDYTVKRSDDNYFNNFPGWNTQPLHWRVIPSEPSTVIIQSGSILTGSFGGTGTFTLNNSQLPPVTFGNEVLDSNELLKISYDINTDITHRAVDLSTSSNEIEMDGLLNLLPGDTIVVQYRKKPRNILRPTVKVKNIPGSSNDVRLLKEGIDYSLDLVNGEVISLAGGVIGNSTNPVVYVDYGYEKIESNTIRFSAWCYYDLREPVKFTYNPLTIRSNLGETISVNFFNGKNFINQRLDNRTEIQLVKGWYNFEIRSLDPAKYNDSAITKLLKLTDINNKLLMLRKDYGGSFFDQINAYANSRNYVSFSNLKTNVLKSDHNSFAIDSNNRIYLNYIPQSTDDLYMYYVDSSGTIVEKTKEDFRLELFKYLNNSESTNPGYIIVRARLSRHANALPGATPKLHSYTLRISY